MKKILLFIIIVICALVSIIYFHSKDYAVNLKYIEHELKAMSFEDSEFHSIEFIMQNAENLIAYNISDEAAQSITYDINEKEHTINIIFQACNYAIIESHLDFKSLLLIHIKQRP